jgi:multiple sugar transport system ATP-binding protein
MWSRARCGSNPTRRGSTTDTRAGPYSPWTARATAKGFHGIRPGDIHLSPTRQGIAAQVVVVEPTGAETELLLQIGSVQVVAVVHGRTAAGPQDTVHLVIDTEKSHVFDAAGGARLG